VHTAYTTNKLGEQSTLSTVSLSEATAAHTAATGTNCNAANEEAEEAVVATSSSSPSSSSNKADPEWTLQEWMPMEDSLEYPPLQQSHQMSHQLQTKKSPSVRRRMSARGRTVAGADAAAITVVGGSSDSTKNTDGNFKKINPATVSSASAAALPLSLDNSGSSNKQLQEAPLLSTAVATPITKQQQQEKKRQYSPPNVSGSPMTTSSSSSTASEEEEGQEELEGGLLVKEVVRYIAPPPINAAAAAVNKANSASSAITNQQRAPATTTASRSMKTLKGSLKKRATTSTSPSLKRMHLHQVSKGGGIIEGMGDGNGVPRRAQEQQQVQSNTSIKKKKKKKSAFISQEQVVDGRVGPRGISKAIGTTSNNEQRTSNSAAAIPATDVAITDAAAAAAIQVQDNANDKKKNKKKQGIVAPSALSSSNKKEALEPTPNPVATAAQPHLYAEINVPSKKVPSHRQANNLLIGRTSSVKSIKSNGDDESDAVSLALTSISSLTGRDSLFHQAADNTAGMGTPTLTGLWCTDTGVAAVTDVDIGTCNAGGVGAGTDGNQHRDAAELENYFDYSDHTEVDHNNYLNNSSGNAGMGGYFMGGSGEEDGIVGKVLGVWNEAFKSTCRCFDIAVPATTNRGSGGKSVTSGGMGMGATIMETVNDTTATIANTMNNMSSKSLPTNATVKQPPTFSKPMEMV